MTPMHASWQATTLVHASWQTERQLPLQAELEVLAPYVMLL